MRTTITLSFPSSTTRESNLADLQVIFPLFDIVVESVDEFDSVRIFVLTLSSKVISDASSSKSKFVCGKKTLFATIFTASLSILSIVYRVLQTLGVL